MSTPVRHLGLHRTVCGAPVNDAPASAPACKRCVRIVTAARRQQAAAVAGSARLVLLNRRNAG